MDTVTTTAEQLVLHALTHALEYDVTPLQWFKAFMSDVSEYIDWGKMDDPQAAYTAYLESCKLADRLTEIVHEWQVLTPENTDSSEVSDG